MYKALYRKWRPLTFDDVISQQHITDTLKNQLRNDKTAHAYLFTGSGGTGKTTCARILAKAVNCPNMKDGNPCLECDICREADDASLIDIVEIDAASNNGVEDIRDLRDGAVYSPERCKFKIYIIDEVHMLSASAFNALLKIMEEPPPYVKFILATTEIHKVPATVASRCQRYDFRRIRSADIALRLRYIAQQENIGLSAEGAALIAKIADGGMRDAVSLLDQCSVCADEITAETVSQAAGIAGREYLFDILDAVFAEDAPKALEVTAQLYDMSKDLTRLCDELILQLRNVMLIKATPKTAGDIITAMPDEMERLRKLAEKNELPKIMEHLKQLQFCREHMGHVINKRVEFELALIRLCSGIHDEPVSSVSSVNSGAMEKIRLLENKIADMEKGKVSFTPKQNEVLTASAPNVENEPPNVRIDIKNLKTDELEPCIKWDDILSEFQHINPSVAGSLDGSKAYLKGNVMCIETPNRFFISLFKSDKNNAISLRKAIFNVLGRYYNISARCTATVEETKSRAEQLIKKAIDSGIETAVDNTNM